MKPIRILLSCLVLLCAAGTWASESQPAPTDTAPLTACEASAGGALAPEQLAQSSCCKGRKGVCGCRAGKIVCCGDGKADKTCTCHGESDQGVVN